MVKGAIGVVPPAASACQSDFGLTIPSDFSGLVEATNGTLTGNPRNARNPVPTKEGGRRDDSQPTALQQL